MDELIGAKLSVLVQIPVSLQFKWEGHLYNLMEARVKADPDNKALFEEWIDFGSRMYDWSVELQYGGDALEVFCAPIAFFAWLAELPQDEQPHIIIGAPVASYSCEDHQYHVDPFTL